MPRLKGARATVATAVAVATLATPGCSAELTPPLNVPHDAPFLLTGVHDVKQVGQITGAEGPGDTTRFAANYMDLGSMFEHNGRVYFTFGDTFGERDPDFTGGGGSFWRSNTLAYTTDSDPSDGIELDGMITDESGSAKEILPSKKVDGVEMTVIPTNGFDANGAMYLHWMSVRHWGDPGEWEVNDAGLAKSVDDGKNWHVLDQPRWSGDSGFVQIAPLHITENGVDTLYVWGITHGRFSGVSLAKVPAAKVEDPSAWQYFAGTGASGKPEWSMHVEEAKLVLDDTVGELSVTWNEYLGRYLMTYLAEGRGIVIREGLTPWGPWGKDFTLVASSAVAGPYAPYMLQKYTQDGGRVIYFTLSIWGPYNVFWYRAELSKD